MQFNLKSVILSAAILGASAPSMAAVITFEGYADLTVFTTQNFGAGVTFAGAQILALGGTLNPSFPPHSGVNVIYNPGGAMTIDFSSAVDFFGGFFTYNQALLIEAYDAANVLIDSASGACTANYISSGCGSPNEYLQVDAAGAIKRVKVSGGGGNNFTVDDVSFTGSRDPGAVPEPGSIALVLAGLGAVAATRRRRAAHA